MYRIIKGGQTGKTHRLMEIAKTFGGIIVCSNPRAMEQKAKSYGFSGIQFISYYDFINCTNDIGPYYIDELEGIIREIQFQNGIGGELKGYTIDNGEGE